MKISANEIKIGNVLYYENDLWVVQKNPEHTKPGKGGAYVQLVMKNQRTGSKMNQRFSATSYVEKAFLESKNMQFLYIENDKAIFMDQTDFSQIELPENILGEDIDFLKYCDEEIHAKIEFFEENPVIVKLQPTISMKVTSTDPFIKGATVTSSYKPAILNDHIKVMVPQYIINGTRIVIKTEDRSFVERMK
ncbi:MAG TPA: elongation factor P [Candidatus Megaira endosymbiont of Hartmannula sinica]|nr:elongation factor P [Candidatus Megaera endosymbiont of Hartmannula sinica]